MMGSTAVDGNNKSINPGEHFSSHDGDLLESSGERYCCSATREVRIGVQLRGYSRYKLLSPPEIEVSSVQLNLSPNIQHLGLAGGVSITRTNAWLA